ncbi:ribosomal protein S18-alanine N-acetyltransferase [Hyphobacterium sp.]|uniref:ribosomal protein S18-alanine N-acetyltransferase n=1 Tax=Hyphobacterium sp. TaxID=2004662 RepID=UPI003BA864CD
MTVASIEKTDCGHLAAIHACCFPRGWSAPALARLLAEPNVIGLRSGTGNSGGFILVRKAVDEAEILTLAVDPDSRRQGVARQLLAEAEKRLVLAGAKRIFLEVSDQNTAARALYAAAGYGNAGRRRRYYSDGSDALVMEKTLAQ